MDNPEVLEPEAILDPRWDDDEDDDLDHITFYSQIVNSSNATSSLSTSRDDEEAEADYLAYEREYEDDRSWEALQEDEHGNLLAVVSYTPTTLSLPTLSWTATLQVYSIVCSMQDDTDERLARRRRMLTAAHSARIRRGMIRYMYLIVDLSRYDHMNICLGCNRLRSCALYLLILMVVIINSADYWTCVFLFSLQGCFNKWYASSPQCSHVQCSPALYSYFLWWKPT